MKITYDELKKIIEIVVSEVGTSRSDLRVRKNNFDRNNEGRISIEDGNAIGDIRKIDFKDLLLVKEAKDKKSYLEIKHRTEARLGLGNSGPRPRTISSLRLMADYACSNDSVMKETESEIIEVNDLYQVQTVVDDKYIYLSRPDLGREFTEEMLNRIRNDCIKGTTVQILASEGLSSAAIEENLTDVLKSLEQGLSISGVDYGTPIYIKFARVPAMDVITELLKPEVTIMLIGERPGLSVHSSLSAYITYRGHVGMEEAGRTVISNIHANGTHPTEAGAEIADIVKLMLKEKKSGTALDIMSS